jgi:hypothetical protein
MRMGRLICWLAVCTVMTVLSVVAMRAAIDGPWASAEALGDVAVSFDGAVRVYGKADGLQIGVDLAVPGTNGGLAFDNPLNLLVANTTNNRLVKLLPAPPHVTSPLATVATQPAPRSIAFAGDGTIYVASAGSPATVRRIPATGICPEGGCKQFTVPTDSTACIGIDLAPDQTTLYYVSGGRKVRTVTGADTVTGDASAAALSPDLQGPGTACGIRLLPPVDARCATEPSPECLSTPAAPFPTAKVGGMLIADARDIKRLNSLGALVETFNAGTGTASQKNWVDIALDPNRRDFWGVDAGFWRLARFRIAGANPMLIDLASAPRGVAVNGELRAAQTIRIVDLTANIAGTATFLEGTPSQHSWSGKLPIAASFAVQAIEVTYDPSGSTSKPCVPSLNIRCRLQEFDSAAGNPVPKTYSRGRSVFYREILRAPLSNPDATFEVGIFFPGPTDLSAGTACVVGGTPPAGTALLRDPWPHEVFTFDGTLVFYGGDDGGLVRTKVNDTIVVNRADPTYYMQLIKPTLGTVGQIGSALQIAIEVRDPRPAAACATVSGLNESLILSVTDITPGEDKGKPLGDSENIFGMLDANGLTWASTANQYRTNLLLDSKFKANHKYRLCVDSPAGQTTNGEPAAGEVCTDIIAKVGSSKK